MLSWFDPELRSDSWFDQEQVATAWFDREFVPATSGGTLTPISFNVSLSMSPAFTKSKAITEAASLVFSSVLKRNTIVKLDSLFGFGSGPPQPYGSLNYSDGAYGGGTVPSMSVARLNSRTLTAALTGTAAMSVLQGNSRVISAILNLTALQQKKVPKTLALGLTVSPVMSPRVKVFKALAAALTVTPAFLLPVKYFRTFNVTGGLFLQALLTKAQTYKRTLAVTLNISGGLAFANQKIKGQPIDYIMPLNVVMTNKGAAIVNQAVTLNLNTAVVKSMPKSVSASLPLSLVLTPAQIRYLAIAASAPLTVSQNRQVFRSLTLSSGLTMTGAFSKVYVGKRTMATLLVLSATEFQKLFITLPDSMSLSVAMVDNPIKARPTLNSSLVLTSAIQKAKLNLFTSGLSLSSTQKNVPLKSAPAQFTLITQMKRRVPGKINANLVLIAFEHDQLTHPKWLFAVTPHMTAGIEIHQHDYKRTNAKSVLIGVSLGESVLLGAELKGN